RAHTEQQNSAATHVLELVVDSQRAQLRRGRSGRPELAKPLTRNRLTALSAMGTWLVSGWLLASCGSSAPNVELSTVSSNPDAPVSEQMEHRAAPSPRDPTAEHAHHHGEEEHADEHGHAPRSSVGEGAPPTSLPPIEHAGDDAQRGRPWMGIEMRD